MKFSFKPGEPVGRYVMTLHLSSALHARLVAAGKKIGIRAGKQGGAGRIACKMSRQELVRQMIDHCLSEMEEDQ